MSFLFLLLCDFVVFQIYQRTHIVLKNTNAIIADAKATNFGFLVKMPVFSVFRGFLTMLFKIPLSSI